MHTLFEKLNRITIAQALLIASGLTLVSVLPLWMYLTQQQATIISKAQTALPAPTILPSPPPVGPVPKAPPSIARIYPWVGKTGDAVVIDGKNFGDFPKNRRLSIGGVMVSDVAISQWTDTRIVALIPENPTQGQPAAIRIDTYPMIESVPLVFYDANTTVRLRKKEWNIQAVGLSGGFQATLMTTNGTRETGGTGSGNTETTLFTLAPTEDILSLVLKNEKGTILPYALNPTEFGF